MKSFLFTMSGLIVVMTALWIFTLLDSAGRQTHFVSADPSTLQTRVYKQACQVFDLTTAKKFLGQQATMVSAGKANVLSDDTATTTCQYLSADAQMSITFDIYDGNASSAGKLFIESEGDVPEVILGVGQKAAWNAQMAKLYVLKGQYLLSVAYKEKARLTDYKLPKDIAATIMEKL